MRTLYQAMSRSARTNRGFTLVELLVVVAIIAILAAIAIPQFTKYRKQAAIAAVMSDARNCVSSAVATITETQMSGGTPPNQGEYTNISSSTQNCNWTFNGTSVSCTCTGKGVAQGVTCTASDAGSASCTGG